MEIIDFRKERDTYVVSPFTGADFTVKEKDLMRFITDERLNEYHIDDELIQADAFHFLNENVLYVLKEYAKTNRDMLIDFRNKFVAYNQVERFEFNDVNTMKRVSIVVLIIVVIFLIVYGRV